MKITAVLPCRKGSKRVLNKNTKKFYKYSMGLLELKIEQLLSVDQIDSIFVSTDDECIIDFILKNYTYVNSKIVVENRPPDLAVDDCLDELICHLSRVVDTDVLIWTHVTSPFFTSICYKNAIETYFSKLSENYDSLLSVTPMHTFALQSGKWISHDATIKKWPRKQDVEKIMFINGAIYIIDRNLMYSLSNRIGNNPYYFELKGLSGYDIDYNEDFVMAEKIAPCILY